MYVSRVTAARRSTGPTDARSMQPPPPPEGRDKGAARYTDAGEWLREDARDRRDVNLLLPVVRGLEKLDECALVTYKELVR